MFDNYSIIRIINQPKGFVSSNSNYPGVDNSPPHTKLPQTSHTLKRYDTLYWIGKIIEDGSAKSP